jgi:Na+/H+-dicarboxylate symporter
MVGNRAFQILFVCTLYFLLLPLLPEQTPEFLYTVSLAIKDVLLWFLPITVFFFLGYTIASYEKKAPLFLLLLFCFEGISNSCCVWSSYLWGLSFFPSFTSIEPISVADSLSPLWKIPIMRPSWWAANKGSFLGIAIGLLPFTKSYFSKGKALSEIVLTKFFSKLIPIFILGFVAKMHKTQLLSQVFFQTTEVLLYLFILIIVYLTLLFYIGPGLKGIPNLFPAAGIAFSSGCSLSTMPWTIEGTSKNLKNKNFAEAVIPATTNIQQVGDCLANTFLCFVIYTQHFGHFPSIATWAAFSVTFVLARYATAAILGGACFLMLPIYESYLHFTPEMLAIIVTLNVVLDPFITVTNVLGNSALCSLFEKLWIFIHSFFRKQSPD